MSKDIYKPNLGYDLCGNQGRMDPNLNDLGVRLHPENNLQKSTLSERLQTFVSWPSNVPVAKKDLAIAGFYYMGMDDCTKCFCCSGILYNWKDGDIPWKEHARWFKNCTFLRSYKNDEFIKSCTVNDLLEDDDISQKTEMAMDSSLITAVLETELLSPVSIKTAVIKRLRETNTCFNRVDDLFEAVAYIEQMDCPQPMEINDQTLNIEMCQPVEEMGEHEMTNDQPVEEMGEHELTKVGESKILCTVCMNEEIQIVLLPCGHFITCVSCVPALKHCPMCRKIIKAIVRAYLP